MTVPFTMPERRRPVRQWPIIALAGLSFVQFLAIGGLLLVLVNGQNDSADRSARAAADRAQIVEQVTSLTEDVARLTADNAAKDRQIARGQAQISTLQTSNARLLTVLRREGIPIPADLQPAVSPTPASSAPPATPSPSAPSAAPTSPAPVAPTPQPTPTAGGLVGGATGLLCLLVPLAC